jgi:hypothetical protein
MAHYKTSVAAFDAAVWQAEGIRQTSVLAAGANMAAARSAEITYFRTCYNAAVSSNVSASVFSQALKSLGTNP